MSSNKLRALGICAAALCVAAGGTWAVLNMSGCSNEEIPSSNISAAQETEKTTSAAKTVAAAASNGPLASRDGFYFDTVISVSLYDTADETILDDCFTLMQRYEDLLSRTKEGSDVWNINHSGGKPVEVADETIEIIQKGLKYCELSDGAFDIAIAPVTSLWDFHQEDAPTVPSDEDLANAVKHVNYEDIHVDGNTVTLSDPEGGIDLGAIAKGYISDGLRDLLVEKGCKSAMINLGGNVMTVGSKLDGSDWKIGIRKPFGTSAYDLINVVPVSGLSVITSGTYERYFEQDGKRYHHILDPNTGYPVDNGLTSVSIISADGTDGDSLSTTCFALGEEDGMKLIESLDGIEALFIDEDNHMTFSSGWPNKD